jgi:hypothetical protein
MVICFLVRIVCYLVRIVCYIGCIVCYLVRIVCYIGCIVCYRMCIVCYFALAIEIAPLGLTLKGASQSRDARLRGRVRAPWTEVDDQRNAS